LVSTLYLCCLLILYLEHSKYLIRQFFCLLRGGSTNTLNPNLIVFPVKYYS